VNKPRPKFPRCALYVRLRHFGESRADPADRRAPGEDDGQAEPEATLPRHCASPPSSTCPQTLKPNPALFARARSHHGRTRMCPQITVGDSSCLVTLVPVDYQPDFEGVSLVPVDYDPFAADVVAQQAQIQQAQAPPQEPPATGAGQAPAAGGGQFSAGTAIGNKAADIASEAALGCIDAYYACLQMRGLRGERACKQAKANCDAGLTTIFAPGTVGGPS
jgi:hypothetical protein